ncbi:MAG: hypothetical protein WCA35_24155, partial [Kovacikia sp.]
QSALEIPACLSSKGEDRWFQPQAGKSYQKLIPICVLYLSFPFTALPAWSTPPDRGSNSAIDLTQQNKAEPGRSQADEAITPRCQQSSSELAEALPPSPPAPASPSLDLPPNLIKSSPVLQRWLQKIPNIQEDIRHDPAFRTRLRLGYSQFPSTNQAGGLNIGLEDLFIGRTGLTLSSDYQASFNGKREAWGTDLRYYVLPLGNRINLAPVLGYRHLETTRYSTDGLNAGLRLLLVPSRTGAADIALTQSWVAPGTDQEVGLTTLSLGYALTDHLRLATDIQKQNARQRKDSRIGIVLEWMF